MPTSWLLSILGIFVAIFYGLLVWQRERLIAAHIFLGEVKSELKKVSWPGRREVVNTTTVVLVAVAFFGLYLSAVDLLVGSARQALFELVVGTRS